MAVYIAELGPVAARQQLLERTAPAGVAALLDVDRALDHTLSVGEGIGARPVIPEDAEWPAALRAEGVLAPVGLWVRGTPRLDQVLNHAVTVVGSRASTAYGEHVASELGHGFARAGWTVVSGGGYGIDAAAHRGAIAAGDGGANSAEGPTVVVTSGGLDRPYPSAHAALFERIVNDGGLLVSQAALGAAPSNVRFRRRTALMVALSAGAVVVEAAARSSALSAVHAAQAIGRPVFAIPGPVTSACSVGCHMLLSSGEARLVTGAADVLSALTTRSA